MELHFKIKFHQRIKTELKLNDLQESHSQHLMLFITKTFFFLFLFLIRCKEIRIFKGTFQKHVLFLSVVLLTPRCFSVGTSIALRYFNQMPDLMIKSEKSN